MRWSIIRLIWFRELRDQLRDRRTVFMIVGLPLLIYPGLGFAVLHFALGFAEKPTTIGIVTGSAAVKDFPPRAADATGLSVLPHFAALAMPTFSPTPAGAAVIPLTLAQAAHQHLDFPQFIKNGRFTVFDFVVLPAQARDLMSQSRMNLVFLEKYDPAWLAEMKGDLVLEAGDDFYELIERGRTIRPAITLHSRPGVDHVKQAQRRLEPLLERWKRDLKQVRFTRMGLSLTLDDPVEFREPQSVPSADPMGTGIADLMVKLFPFMLVMWSLAGALYPAVDICAGEKERGTMETLLITPAGRQEIVLGKFLTIWVFSAGTAILNLVSMGITTWSFSGRLPQSNFSLGSLAWCVVLALPLAALFSAVSLAIGAYARSSKEGQYYLMPLFLVTMPLIFLTLAPGVELSPFYSLVPVTGVALLMQKLMTATTWEQIPWVYFVAVLLPIGIYSWLALRWAIEQFQREEVLFREAERLDVMLWFRTLLREKEALPTTAQAFFCFALILGLRWFSLGLGSHWPLEVHASIVLVAFVATPPMLMALMLSTKPRDALYLHRPRWRELGLAALLALLLLPPLTALSQAVSLLRPDLLEGRHPIIDILKAINQGEPFAEGQYFAALFAFALLPALCEEIAFRGFLLSGLHRRFRPRNAVLVSAFLFALYHMNVFLFLPMFLLGVILALLTVRSRSLLPAICLHFLHNSMLIAGVALSDLTVETPTGSLTEIWPWVIGSCLIAAAGLLWWLYRKPYRDLQRLQNQASEAGRVE
jgi:sodium transport system permease protein